MLCKNSLVVSIVFNRVISFLQQGNKFINHLHFLNREKLQQQIKWYLLQNSHVSCKKGVWPSLAALRKMARMKKLWNIGNSCGSQSMAKKLITTILCWFLVKLGWGNTNSSQSFLGCHLDFTTFSSWPSCIGLPDWIAPFL